MVRLMVVGKRTVTAVVEMSVPFTQANPIGMVEHRIVEDGGREGETMEGEVANEVGGGRGLGVETGVGTGVGIGVGLGESDGDGDINGDGEANVEDALTEK